MLVVKPNPRRMRYMRDSPSERPGEAGGDRFASRIRWERVVFAVGLGGTALLGLIFLALHH